LIFFQKEKVERKIFFFLFSPSQKKFLKNNYLQNGVGAKLPNVDIIEGTPFSKGNSAICTAK